MRRATHRLSPPTRVGLVTTAIGLCAIAVVLAGVVDLPSPDRAMTIPWWLLAVAVVIAEACSVSVRFRGGEHTFTLAELPLVFGLLFTDPLGVVLATVVGTGVVLAIDERQVPMKMAFNLAQAALGSAVAVCVFSALAPATAVLGPGAWAAAGAATIASAGLSALLVSTVIGLSGSRLSMREVGGTLGMAIGVSVTNSALALGGASAVAADPWAAVLLAVPAAALVVAYRAYVAESRGHEALGFLHDVTRALAAAPDMTEAVDELLTRTLEVFRGSFAQVVLLPSDDMAHPLGSTRHADGRVESMQNVSRSLADDLHSLVDLHGSARSLAAAELRGPLAAELRRREVDSVMVAALQGETRTIGIVMVGRPDGGSVFDADDLRLFGTLAGHASVSLEYDRLEIMVRRLRELQAELEHRANHDPLTGLANRVLFLQRLEDARAAGSDHAVLFLDLDDFKTINDSIGHAVGDELLRAVADRLRANIAERDTACRLGGDEFALLLRDVHEPEEVTAVADRLLDVLASPFAAMGHSMSVQVSIGIAEGWGHGATSAGDVLRNADVAMYRAKGSGKQRHATYESGMHASVLRRHRLKEDLHLAIEREELTFELQPIVEVATERIVAVEALARWDHPTFGRIMPTEFIPLAEETDFVVAIDLHVLDGACRRGVALPDVAVHVNLSTRTLRGPDLIANVARTLASTGLPAERLVLELTESSMVTECGPGHLRLHELRDLGARVAIDDFGTGYCALGYLQWVPFDILKLAKPFTDEVADTGRGRHLAQAMVHLAHALGATVVAEGIERREQAEALRAIGCQLGQGYLYDDPRAAVQLHRAPAALGRVA